MGSESRAGLAETHDEIASAAARVGLAGRGLHSINDLTDEQIQALLDLGLLMEPWRRSRLDLLGDKVLLALFFQPSTRTRLSFETAMHRLGGSVITEANPLVASSAAKEESLSDGLRVMSEYADVIVLRHYDALEARGAVADAGRPVINAGWGHWEHPTQALLDLFTLYRTFGRIKGLRVCVASPDMVEARTGHSMVQGLARLGADVTVASRSERRLPQEVADTVAGLGRSVREELDLTQDSFNELVAGMDVVYLPGCSAPKGADSEAFKKTMDDYYVRYETLQRVHDDDGRIVYVTHTLPRRPGEMDVRIDDSDHQLYFKACGHGVTLRMALLAATLS
jgi:aspartate carbamoyltransferase catalytic subunit